MSIAIIVEVLDHAPANLTSGERLVLLVLAEHANERTRIARQTQTWTIDTICRRAGIKRTGLKTILQGLAKKGMEVRVPIRYVDGKPIFAYEGRTATFRIPAPTEWGGHSIPTCQTSSGDATASPLEPRGEATASALVTRGEATASPIPSKNYPSKISLSPSVQEPTLSKATTEERDNLSSKSKDGPSSRDRAVANSTLTDDQKPRFIAWITDKYTVETGTWWRTAHRNGDIPMLVEKFEAYEETQRRSGPCPEHGRSGRISYCYECESAYDAADFYLEHPGFTVEQAAAYLRCPEHIDHDIGTCPECRSNRGDAAYWMTHDQADVPPHNPNRHGPSTNQRHAVRHSHDSLNN